MMKIKNLQRKKELLEENTFKEYRQVKRALYTNAINEGKTNDEAINIANEKVKEHYSEEDYTCLYQMSESAKKQRKKVKNHVEYLFNKTKYKIYFITYTFNDDYLKKTKITTRKRKIIELLSDDDIKDYIVNIDFGKENEREHYHAIVAISKNSSKIKKDGTNKVIFEPYEDKKTKEKVGYYNIKECNCENEDREKLAKYIVKLTQHSIKVKQSYISVKKGSEYQITKKLVKEYVSIDHHSTKPLERRKKDIYVILDSLNDEKNNEMTSKLYNLFDSKLTINDD